MGFKRTIPGTDVLVMDNAADLRVLIATRYPLIFVEAKDEGRLMGLLRDAVAPIGTPLWRWSATRGIARDGGEPVYQTTEPMRALAFIDDLDGHGVFVFADGHHALEDPRVVRRVKELAHAAGAGRTIVVTAPRTIVPPELQGLAASWTLRPPSEEELAALLGRTLEDLRARAIPIHLGNDERGAFVDALRGLSAMEAERLIQRAALRDGAIDGADVAFVRGEKAGLLDTGGALELIEADQGTLHDVGGLERLKHWLQVRGRAFEPAAASFGLEPPRGVLVTGVPGCGKSFCAKTLARTWKLPLVLLDVGSLYGPYVGESEGRLRDALATVDAMAPVVLWIDEIEKAFAAGGNADGGVGQRILGTFLRWMQERAAGTFVIATANDVGRLPPELLRKGRFDEVFFVDLPDAAARERILSLHLRRRGHDPAIFELPTLASAADGFSGAEIEAAIVGALYHTYASGSQLGTADVLAELARTVPLSRTRAEDVARLRGWAAERAVPASGAPAFALPTQT